MPGQKAVQPDFNGTVMRFDDELSRANNVSPSGMNLFHTLYRAFPDALIDDDTQLLIPGGTIRAGDVNQDTVLLAYNGKPTRVAAIAKKQVKRSYRVELETKQAITVAPSTPLFSFAGKDGCLATIGTTAYCRNYFINAKKKSIQKPSYQTRLPAAMPSYAGTYPAASAGFSAGYLAPLTLKQNSGGTMNLTDILNSGGTAISFALRTIADETGAPMTAVKKTRGRGALHNRVTGIRLTRADTNAIWSAVSPMLTLTNKSAVLSDRLVWAEQNVRLSVLRGAATACGRSLASYYELGPLTEPNADVLIAIARSLGLKAEWITPKTDPNSTAKQPTGVRIVRIYTNGRLDLYGAMPKIALKCTRAKVQSIEPAGPKSMTCIAPEPGIYGLMTADYMPVLVTLAAHEWDRREPVYAPGTY